jgi:anti-sigma-K factor RskA
VADCSQLAELYEAFALGALDPGEGVELRAHLARGCPVCTAGVARARETVANLAYLAPAAEPPASLRRNLMEAVRAESPAQPQRARPWIPAWAWTAAAALLLFSVYSTVEMRRFQNEAASLEKRAGDEQKRSRALDAERQRYQTALNIIAAPATRQMELKPAKADMPGVTAYWNPKMGLVLAADKMPEMPPTRTLQVWVVPRQGAPISVGVFRPGAGGQMLMVMPPDQEAMNMAKALAISDEPAGGSPQPTSAPEWVGPIA